VRSFKVIAAWGSNMSLGLTVIINSYRWRHLSIETSSIVNIYICFRNRLWPVVLFFYLPPASHYNVDIRQTERIYLYGYHRRKRRTLSITTRILHLTNSCKTLAELQRTPASIPKRTKEYAKVGLTTRSTPISNQQNSTPNLTPLPNDTDMPTSTRPVRKRP